MKKCEDELKRACGPLAGGTDCDECVQRMQKRLNNCRRLTLMQLEGVGGFCR